MEQWSNDSKSEQHCHGHVFINITDVKGCTSAQNAISVTQPSAALTSSASTTNVNCFGDAKGRINLTVNGGTTPYSYNWSNGAITQNLSAIGSKHIYCYCYRCQRMYIAYKMQYR
ncbi:MAG: SprB repeat-containing protein [Bacteroidia bacterium]